MWTVCLELRALQVDKLLIGWTVVECHPVAGDLLFCLREMINVKYTISRSCSLEEKGRIRDHHALPDTLSGPLKWGCFH